MANKASVRRGKKNAKGAPTAEPEAIQEREIPADETPEAVNDAPENGKTTPETDEAAPSIQVVSVVSQAPTDTMRIPQYLLEQELARQNETADAQAASQEKAAPSAKRQQTPQKQTTAQRRQAQAATANAKQPAQAQTPSDAQTAPPKKSPARRAQTARRRPQKSAQQTALKTQIEPPLQEPQQKEAPKAERKAPAPHRAERQTQPAQETPTATAKTPRRKRRLPTEEERQRRRDAVAWQLQQEEEALEREQLADRQREIEEKQERLREQAKEKRKKAREERRRKEAEEARIEAEVERRVKAAEEETAPQIIMSPKVTRARRATMIWITVGVVALAMISVILGIRYDRMRRQLEASAVGIDAYRGIVEDEVVEGADLQTLNEPDGGNVAQVVSEDGVRRVYLTFDDGPSAVTTEVLDILKEYNVKATFFVLGREDDASKAIYRRIVDEGHTLAMHSYDHNMTNLYASLDSFQADLHRLQNYLYEVTGVWCTIYRFPGGSSTTASRVEMQELTEYLSREHIVYYDWNVYGGDDIAASVIVSNVKNNVASYNNAVVLMHDAADKEETAQALPEIIEYIQSLDRTILLPITEDTMPVQHGAGEETEPS